MNKSKIMVGVGSIVLMAVLGVIIINSGWINEPDEPQAIQLPEVPVVQDNKEEQVQGNEKEVKLQVQTAFEPIQVMLDKALEGDEESKIKFESSRQFLEGSSTSLFGVTESGAINTIAMDFVRVEEGIIVYAYIINNTGGNIENVNGEISLVENLKVFATANVSLSGELKNNSAIFTRILFNSEDILNAQSPEKYFTMQNTLRYNE